VLILIHSRPNSIGKHSERAAIVCDDEALRGWLPVEAGAESMEFQGRITRMLAATATERLDEPEDDDDV
jgi:hypothetical protein